MNINVVAKRLGYYNLKRRYEGHHFQMKLKDFVKKEAVRDPKDKEFFKVDGKEYLVPSWVDVLVDDKPKKVKPATVQEEPQEEQIDEVI